MGIILPFRHHIKCPFIDHLGDWRHNRRPKLFNLGSCPTKNGLQLRRINKSQQLFWIRPVGKYLLCDRLGVKKLLEHGRYNILNPGEIADNLLGGRLHKVCTKLMSNVFKESNCKLFQREATDIGDREPLLYATRNLHVTLDVGCQEVEQVAVSGRINLVIFNHLL